MSSCHRSCVTAQGSIGGPALSRAVVALHQHLFLSPIRRRMELKSGFGGSLEPLFLEEWLLSLRPGAKTREERSCLVEKCARGARQRSARLCLASVLDE